MAASRVIDVAKTKQDQWVCTECGWTSVRWVGKCGECQAWGSVAERGAPKLTEVASNIPAAKAIPINQVRRTPPCAT